MDLTTELNMFSSQTKSKDLDTHMINIWRSACVFDWTQSTPYLDVPYGYRLSGTPLNEAMVSLHQLLSGSLTFPLQDWKTGADRIGCRPSEQWRANTPWLHAPFKDHQQVTKSHLL